jgi:hypothetical protein
MRVLIDECIDERFRNYLPGHECQTAPYAGLAGLKNGDLLTAAENAQFDVFLTVDQGIEYQQNLTGRRIAIIIFRLKSNRLKKLLSHVPSCLMHITSVQPGQIVRIEDPVVILEDPS